MEIFIVILGFILFVKCFFFWLWLWQLKEYHLGRFRAHFEAQAMRKILSSFWRLKFPKFTSKIVVISFSGILLAILITYFIFSLPNKDFYLALLVLIFFAPLISSLIILFFQIPTVILRNRILEKAKQKRNKFKDLLVVGITGSYGKTSTKEFLATILSGKFNVLKTKEHQNSEMGISQCILNDLKEEYQIFIVEMGAYNKGGIKLLCDIAQPQVGVVTGVNEQHLATFGTMENLLSAEGGEELIEDLPEDGIAFFNGKNKYCLELYNRTSIKKFLYGENVKLQGLENIEGAKAIAKELGMSEEEISRACQKIENKFPGIQIKKGINGLNIIDATYSANPDGVMAHLEYLKTLPGRKVIVMPCLIELGRASKEVHWRIGKKIGEVCDLAIITTKDRFKEIKEGAGEKVIFMENPKEIFEKIKSFCQEGDVILLESRVPHQLIGKLCPVVEFQSPSGAKKNFKEILFEISLRGMFRPISISLSPNTEKDDVLLAFKLLCQPWRWKKGKAIQEIENQFEEYLGVKNAISFNSGRAALMAILNSLGLERGSEVLLQAFTCNAAVNPILWAELKPIFVDCDEKTFNMDIEDLKRKITPMSRVVMVQHTFGLPANMDEILEICHQHNLILIEDCAHSLGAEYQDRKVGTFGQAAFFSFSRDKVISSVYGGMVITNDENLAKKLREYQKKIGFPSDCWIFQQLLHPVLINWLVLPSYKIFGKYLLILFQWLQVLSKAVHWKEKRGLKPGYFPKQLPNALAILVLNQFKKLERFNNHRKKIAEIYRQELKNTSFELPQEEEQIYLRFTVKHPKAHEIIKKTWQKNLLIGDWYTTPIAPHDTKLDKMKYLPGSCQKAEKLSPITLNLPTHINILQKEAKIIIDFLKLYGN